MVFTSDGVVFSEQRLSLATLGTAPPTPAPAEPGFPGHCLCVRPSCPLGLSPMPMCDTSWCEMWEDPN